MYYLNTYCKVHFVRIPVGKESGSFLSKMNQEKGLDSDVTSYFMM